MGLVRLPMLLAAHAIHDALQDLKAAMRSAIAGVAAGLHLCSATGRELMALPMPQPAQ